MSSHQKKSIWTVICVVVFAVSVFFFAYAKAGTKPAAAGANSKKTAPQPMEVLPRKPRFEGELIVIHPSGFQPAQITRRHGRFFLFVDNRSGISEVSLQLHNERGNRIHEARARHEDREWSEEFDLPPGRYILTEENHRNWVCHITLTP